MRESTKLEVTEALARIEEMTTYVNDVTQNIS
jgi:hypothetical protein